MMALAEGAFSLSADKQVGMECGLQRPEKTNKSPLQDTLDPSQPLDQLSWRFSNESHADCIKNMISQESLHLPPSNATSSL